jgi:hypothetical protein
LACFGDGFGGSDSFLDIGSHCFYVAKLFLEEVTDILNPLSDGGLSCSESYDFGTMVEVMALGDEEGGDPPRSTRPPLERLPPQEQNAPLPEQDTLDVTVVDLRTPLDRVIDSAWFAEALEWTRLVLLSRAAEEEATQRRMSTTLREFYDAHGGIVMWLSNPFLCEVHCMREHKERLDTSMSSSCRSSCHFSFISSVG